MWKYFEDEKPKDCEIILFAFTVDGRNPVNFGRYFEKGKHPDDDMDDFNNSEAGDVIDGTRYAPEGAYVLNHDKNGWEHHPTAYAWMPFPQAPNPRH